MSFFKRHLSFFKYRYILWNIYRINAISDFLVEFFRIVILYFFWTAVFRNSNSEIIGGYSLEEMIGYVFISVIIYTYTSGDTIFLVSNKVRRGDITQELIKPIDFQTSFFMGDLANKTILLFLTIPPLLVGIYFFKIPHPVDIYNWSIFMISIFLAGIIHFYYEFTISILSFYMTNLWGITITNEAIFEFFSGALIPISFFPHWLIKFCDFLPFKYIIFIPVNLFLGKISYEKYIFYTSMQLLWAIIMFIAGRIVFNFAIKKVVIHGG